MSRVERAVLVQKIRQEQRTILRCVCACARVCLDDDDDDDDDDQRKDVEQGGEQSEDDDAGRERERGR